LSTSGAQVELVVLVGVVQALNGGDKLPMLFAAPLAAAGAELLGQNSQGNAGLAAIAIGAIGEHAAAPEAQRDQFRIGGVLNQVTGCGDLRTCQPARQVAAGIGCRGIELQGM
jgi:hypothetical protein